MREEAAFLVASAQREADHLRFDVVEVIKLEAADFATQESDYLELADATRARLIKQAHDLRGSLIELHSHPGPMHAEFSRADREGLAETVRHMRWRLPKQPYAAIVMAPSGFDALVWTDNPRRPQPLNRLVAGDRVLEPTHYSLRGWT